MNNQATRCLLILVLAVWMSFAVEASAQVVYSNIRGFVTDQKGLGIQGAAITLLDESTGVQRSTKSGEDGSYLFDNIVSGSYTIRVESEGFKKHESTSIGLTASETIRIDIALEVGSVTERVTVAGETPVIETETPTISFDYLNSLANELPTAGSVQGGRIPETVYHIVPGGAPGVGAGAFNGLAYADEKNTMDGVRVVQQLVEPTLESIEEIKITTHNASAEYATATTTELTSRQGSNNLHGDLSWLYQDKGLDARDPILGKKPFLHSHLFAGSLGGPIIRNKAFFYLGIEALRQNNSSDTAVPVDTLNLPTAKMQQGDFSELLDPTFVNLYNGGQFVTVIDPLTGTPFQGNVIPSNRISTVSRNLISRFWIPPDLPGLAGNHFVNALRPASRTKYTGRVDYNVSSRHTLFVSYLHGFSSFVQPTTDIKPANAADARFIQPNQMIVFSDIFNITPHLTNEFRFGYSWTREALTSPFDNVDVMGAAGIVNSLGITGLPGISINGFTGISPRNAAHFPQTGWDASNHVSMLLGKHNLKAGGQFIRNYVGFNSPTSPPGFSFDGTLSGFGWADFMLGLPASAGRALEGSNFTNVQNEWGFFVTDEFHARKTLTLSLGLRYSILPYAYEQRDQLAIFDPKLQAIIVPSERTKSFIDPTFPQSVIPVLTAKEAGYPATGRSLQNTDLDDFQPRVGFAWRPFGWKNAVVRGGYGLYNFDELSAGGTFGGGSSLFSGSQSLSQKITNGTPLIAFPDPFSAFRTAGIQTLDPFSLSLGAGDPNLKTAFVEDWNLTVERDVSGWGVRVSYLGEREHDQFITDHGRPIPNGPDISFAQNGGRTMANGLQVLVNKPMKHGFSLNGGYTLMKKLTDLNFVGGGSAFDQDRFYGRASFATPDQQLILTYAWDAPVGRKRRFLSNLPGFADAIIGGWQVLGITKFETGQYGTPFYLGVDPTTAGATPGAGVGPELPDRIGNPNLPHSKRNPGTGQPFFNIAAFACPGGSVINGQPNLLTQGCPLSTPQNVGRWGNSRPNTVVLPGLNIWNLSVGKRFALPREGASFYVGAQFYNPWNHPNWDAPDLNLSSPSTVGKIVNTRNLFIDPFSLARRRIGLELRTNF